jgi:hypothetical protein
VTRASTAASANSDGTPVSVFGWEPPLLALFPFGADPDVVTVVRLAKGNARRLFGRSSEWGVIVATSRSRCLVRTDRRLIRRAGPTLRFSDDSKWNGAATDVDVPVRVVGTIDPSDEWSVSSEDLARFANALRGRRTCRGPRCSQLLPPGVSWCDECFIAQGARDRTAFLAEQRRYELDAAHEAALFPPRMPPEWPPLPKGPHAKPLPTIDHRGAPCVHCGGTRYRAAWAMRNPVAGGPFPFVRCVGCNRTYDGRHPGRARPVEVTRDQGRPVVVLSEVALEPDTRRIDETAVEPSRLAGEDARRYERLRDLGLDDDAAEAAALAEVEPEWVDLPRRRWICPRCKWPLSFWASSHRSTGCYELSTPNSIVDGWERVHESQARRLGPLLPEGCSIVVEPRARGGLYARFWSHMLRSPHWPILSIDQLEAAIAAVREDDAGLTEEQAVREVLAADEAEQRRLAERVGIECVARSPRSSRRRRRSGDA